MADYQTTLLKLNDNLNTLRERESKYAGNAPVALLNQMSDHQQAIALTEQAIAGDLTEAAWREEMRPLNIDHALIEGGFFQRILQALSLPTEQQRELRNRQIMLQRVHDFWVKGVLENSLHNEVLIELGMEECKEAVGHPWEMVIQRPDRPNRQLPPGTKIIDVFDESGGSLLILGEPGSGKTTMLLELTRQLIARTQADPTQPMPVVFNLSSWAEQQLPLAKWLVEELYGKYNISKKLAQRWLNNDSLLPLLDGLDEVVPKRREACVRAINQFYQDRAPTMVVCCRLADYEALSSRLRLQHSIRLQSLTTEQVEVYLNRVTPEPSLLRAVIRNDANLQELARSPLMLSIMTLILQDVPGNAFQTPTSLDAYREEVFNAYICHMFNRRGIDQRYSPEQTLRWLSWLAQKMKQHGQTTFFIEQIQSSWLSTQQQQRFYEISIRLIGGMIFMVIGTLSALLAVGLAIFIRFSNQAIPMGPVLTVGFVAGLAFMLSSVLAARRWVVPLIVLAIGVILALTRLVAPVTALIAGLIFGLPGAIAGLPLAQRQPIQISDTFNWTWNRAGWGILLGLAAGLIIGVLSPYDKLVNSLQTGLPVGLILTLMLCLGRVEHIHTQTRPNHGLHRSIRHAVRLGLIIFLIILLFGVLVGSFQNNLVIGVAFGVLMAGIIGLATGLYAGGNASLQHGMLRYILYSHGDVPWHLVEFLDYAVDRIFLRKVGHGYIFVHQWFLDHFVTLRTEERF